MEKCKNCNGDFEPVNGNQKHCSTKCKDEWKVNKRTKEIECAHCGKKATRVIHPNRESYFCSMICASLHSGRTSLRECESCGDKFTTKTSKLKLGFGKFCNKSCHDKWMSEQEYDDKKVLSKEEIHRMYEVDGLTTHEIGYRLNVSKTTILRRLRQYGIEVKGNSIFGLGGLLECKDGHLVRSHYEKSFDDAMTALGMKREYETRLPFNKRYATDFLVGDIYVEIWGMMDVEKYRIKRMKKVKMYKENNCKLFEVYPEDFRDLYGKVLELKRLL